MEKIKKRIDKLAKLLTTGRYVLPVMILIFFVVALVVRITDQQLLEPSRSKIPGIPPAMFIGIAIYFCILAIYTHSRKTRAILIMGIPIMIFLAVALHV